MKKKFLTRNKHYTNLNILFSSQNKSEKKLIFKTAQEGLSSHNNLLTENNEEENFNTFYNHIKNKNIDAADNLTQMILSNTNFKKEDYTNIKTITSRNNCNHSISKILDKKINIKEFSPCSKIFLRSVIKINKPKLLKILNRNLINFKNSETEKKNLKHRLSFIPASRERTLDEFIYDKSTSTRINNDKKINKNFFKDINERYLINNYSSKNNEELNNKNEKDFIKTLKKFPKINLSFPFQLMNSINIDKKESKDTVNTEAFNDEKLKRKLRKALYFEINSFEYDNGKYIEYKNSLQNYINFIYDINIVPHIKNRFLYKKPIYEPRKINEILFSKNAICKEDAKALNRYIINSIKKEELEKEFLKIREKKMKELSKSNNYLQKLCLDYEDEDMPKLTSDEMVELSDFFGKIINYKNVNFASNKLKDVVYQESKNIVKKNKDKENIIPLLKIIS